MDISFTLICINFYLNNFFVLVFVFVFVFVFVQEGSARAGEGGGAKDNRRGEKRTQCRAAKKDRAQEIGKTEKEKAGGGAATKKQSSN